MIIAKIRVNGAIAKTVYRKVIPAGIIGAQVEFDYDEDIWHGLHKTVVFKGAVTKDVVTDANIVTIPHEVVEKPFFQLSIGVYGVNADGNIVIPTLWEDIGDILDATTPSGDTNNTDPSPPVWAQIQAMIGNLDELETTARDNLVAAVNEVAQSGGSASIAMRVDGGFIQYSTDDGKTWVNLIAEADLKGDKGADGKSAYQYAQDGGYTGTEAEFSAKLAREKFANPNALTFTGAVTGSYDGSAPLSVEIPSGGGSAVELDTTLTQSGKAADAKAVGDALAGKQNTISDLETIRSGAAKGATALQAVPSTYRTATAQDAIDNGLSDRVSAIEGKEAGWNGKYSKPADGIPKADLANDVQALLGKADTALQEHQSLAAYRTAEAQNIIDDGKQDKITSTNKLAYSLISGTPTIPTVPTNVSAFTNDAGYLTLATLPKYEGVVE